MDNALKYTIRTKNFQITKLILNCRRGPSSILYKNYLSGLHFHVSRLLFDGSRLFFNGSSLLVQLLLLGRNLFLLDFKGRDDSELGLLVVGERSVAFPGHNDNRHACFLGGISLLDHVSVEDDFTNRLANLLGNLSVALLFNLGSNLGVEVVGDHAGDVSLGGVSEEQLLGFNRARREDVQLLTVSSPFLELRNDI
jgi:hypothetical protein